MDLLEADMDVKRALCLQPDNTDMQALSKRIKVCVVHSLVELLKEKRPSQLRYLGPSAGVAHPPHHFPRA